MDCDSGLFIIYCGSCVPPPSGALDPFPLHGFFHPCFPAIRWPCWNRDFGAHGTPGTKHSSRRSSEPKNPRNNSRPKCTAASVLSGRSMTWGQEDNPSILTGSTMLHLHNKMECLDPQSQQFGQKWRMDTKMLGSRFWYRRSNQRGQNSKSPGPFENCC